MEFVFCSRWGSQRRNPAVRGFILAVLLSLGIQPSSGFSFTIGIEPLNPKRGENVKLDVAYGASIQKVTWSIGSQRPENIILTYRPSSNITSPGPLFTGRQKVLSSGSLEISNVMKNDSGTYIVILSTSDGDQRSEANLYVMDASESPATRGPAPGSTEGPAPMLLPIWASAVIAVVAFIVVASVILGVILYNRNRNSTRTERGISASNNLSRQTSSYYENENVRHQNRPLPAVINYSPEFPSPYMDLKYSTSSVYEELQ